MVPLPFTLRTVIGMLLLLDARLRLGIPLV